MNRLNGWVRLGLVFSAIWVLLVLAVAGYELADPKFRNFDAFFAYKDIPVGTVFTVVDGKEPWDHDFESDSSIKKITVIRSQKLLTCLFIPVAGGWLLAAGLVFAVRWVRAGFRQKIS